MKNNLLILLIFFSLQGSAQSLNPWKATAAKEWIYIPASTFGSNGMIGNDSFNFDNRERIISENGFYIYRTEVTNALYLQFLKENSGSEFLPDTTCWNTDFGVNYHTPMVEKYLRSTTYANYPVVGVSQLQALKFCQWMEKNIRSELSKIPDFNDYTCELTLPTNNQWESAFYRAYLHNHKDSQMGNWVIQQRIVSSKGKNLVNYGQESTSEGYILKNYTSDGGLFPTSFTAFKPNKIKLFDLLGNVSELTLSNAFNTTDTTEISVDKSQHKIHYLKLRNGIRDTLNTCHFWGKMENIQKIMPGDGYIAAKGGSWLHGIFYMQPSVSLFVKPTEQHSYIGFRPVLVLKRKNPQTTQNLNIEN